MNREQLSKYKKNKRDIENLDGIIAKLQERLDAVPVVSGKVTKSSDDFPYIEEHVQVRVEEPKAATALKMRIREKEKRKDQLIQENEEVEKYIAAMPDGTAKDIFEIHSKIYVYIHSVSNAISRIRFIQLWCVYRRWSCEWYGKSGRTCKICRSAVGSCSRGGNCSKS